MWIQIFWFTAYYTVGRIRYYRAARWITMCDVRRKTKRDFFIFSLSDSYNIRFQSVANKPITRRCIIIMCIEHYNINDETRIENRTRTITVVIICVFTLRVYNNYIISWNVIRIDGAIAMCYNLHLNIRLQCNIIYRWLTNRVHPLFFL